MIADPNTWGHVKWEQELTARGIAPAFGFSFRVENGPEYVAAGEPRALYEFVSAQDFSVGAVAALDERLTLLGFVPFSPEIDERVDAYLVTPLSRLAGSLAIKSGKPFVLCSHNNYASEDDRDTFMALTDNRAVTPQHIMSPDELREFFGDELFGESEKNAAMIAKKIGRHVLEKAPMIHFDGDLDALVEAGKLYMIDSGRIDWTDEYQARLEREMTLIKEKEFESYFLVVADLVQWAKERMLVGPGRGSSAGSLVCYLLRITEVDPIKNGLLFERFIDVNRADLPDIDIDFSHNRRYMVFEYLAEKYGSANVARLGSINTLKARSVMMECGKRLAIPGRDLFKVRDVLIEYSSGDARFGKGLEDTFENTGPGRRLVKEYPSAMHMTRTENHAWHTGQHAAGVLVSNYPVTNYCAVVNGIAQIDKKGAEYLGLLKIDALGLTTLGVIEDAGVVDGETLYQMPLDDPAVFKVFNDRLYAGIFQFEGASQRRVASQIEVTSFREIDHVTALARPGPLGGGAANRYIITKKGAAELTYLHPILEQYLNDTFGVVLYQEQVMKIVKEVGDFSWEDTSTVRKAMSGRKGEEFFNRMRDKFIAGAAKHGIEEETADAIWKEIYSFGAWGMNASHTCSYAVISYWCAWMKAYHPVEYAAAILRATDKEERIIEILRELSAEGVEWIPFDAERSGIDWAAVDGRVIGGFKNIVGVGPVKAAALIQRRDSGTLTEKDKALLANPELVISDLREAHTEWGHLYKEPERYNIIGPIREFADLKDSDYSVLICKLIRLERRDENENVRIMRRGGERMEGQTKFLDMFVVDDSVSTPVRIRISRRDFPAWGDKIADNARPGRDWFLIRGKWLGQFSMFNVRKIKPLNNEDIKI